MAGRCSPAGERRAATSSRSEHGPGVPSARARRRYAFPPEHRLRSPADFRRVLKTGRRRSDALFTLVVARGDDRVARLGIAVSRKVSKSAVKRNRVKRLVREAFRDRTDLAPLDIVVIGRSGVGEATGPAIRRSLQQHFDGIETICAGSLSS